MRIVFIADPVAKFDPETETTFFLMAEMNRRGWAVYAAELKDLFADGRTVRARVSRLEVRRTGGRFRYRVTGVENFDLARADAVLLRKDPPVDLNFITHLTLLERLEGRVSFINSPLGINRANEKIFPLEFDDLAPPTLVTMDGEAIRSFVRTQRRAVLKPLNLSGGRGIVIAGMSDPSLGALIDLATGGGTRYIIAQKYIAEARLGDKRILLWDGEPLGCFLRVPRRGDFRGNLHSGAKLRPAKLNARDRAVVSAVASRLRDLGLVFVGLDLLGGFLTEINVTSPMGLGELNRLYGVKSEKTVLDGIERMASKARSRP